MQNTVFKIIACLSAFWMLLSLCSCRDFRLSPVEELLRAPKLTGENAAIQETFENAVGGKVSLITPILGEYRSAYVFYDYDRDSAEEAVVFYTKSETPDEVHMHLLDKNGENWYSVCDIVGNGSEVQKIQFANLDKDGDYEFAVTWTVSDSKRTKTLSIYKFRKEADGRGNLKQLTALQLQDYLILDLDLDGSNEVLYSYSTLKSENLTFDTAVFRIDPENLTPTPLCEISLSKNIDSILNYSYDKAVGSYTVYVDCLAADGRYFTEILDYDYEKAALVRPQDENGNYLCTKTYRADSLLSEDYNNDYSVEIPAQTEMEPPSYLDDSANQTQGKLVTTAYCNYSQGQLNGVDKYFVNTYDGFRIKINDYYDSMYIVYSIADHTTRFRLKETSSEDNLLFTVKWNDNGDEESSSRHADIVITKLGRDKDISADSVEKNIEAI